MVQLPSDRFNSCQLTTHGTSLLIADGWTPAALINGSFRLAPAKLQRYTVAVLVNIYVLA